MKKSIIRRLRSAKSYGIVTACSWGLFTMTAYISICGLALSRFGIPDYAVFGALCFGMAMSGYISGYILGRINRRNGFISGIKCGAVLFVISSVFGIMYLREFGIAPIVRSFLFILLPAAAGGTIGANSKTYAAPYR